MPSLLRSGIRSMAAHLAFRSISLGFICSLAMGCDGLGNGALVHVYSAHHATPEDGLFPDRGAEAMSRTFENDTGWEVTLTQSYITMNAVSLVSCDGESHPLDMFWGPCPENLHDEDLEALTVAGSELPAGKYCALRVEYAPFHALTGEDATPHEVTDAAIEGTTIYLRGGARRDGGDWIPFELKSDRVIRVHLDISALDGSTPLEIRKQQDFPSELTVTKTYDRFFDGVDFSAFDPAALEQGLPQVLIEQTRVVAGTAITNARTL